MAQFNFPIKIIPLWRNKTLSAGDIATSDPIDVREVARAGVFSLSVSVAAGTAGTTGTTVFTYSGCSRRDGTYVTPASANSVGTYGTGIAADMKAFAPALMPFIKIIATQTGTGTAGKDSLVTAELNVQ